ncbi:MAG: RdgB/HAM1 family non-canonical purine NTP pyrophosphatase [Betaproteobacteria bacterium]|nr:RdgB/HAM1 family non-canonical purine NTP pyrophosphatase [Betaproteobacteria bacterium]
MTGIDRLVLASNNPGKLREIRALLAPLAIDVVTQAELGIAEADEPHATFLENALAKARHASAAAGMPALADDSGLCVAALGGEPGVQSAYYAGRSGSRAQRDARNNAKLIAALSGVADRRAHYYCMVVLVRRADDPQPVFCEGLWRGEIAAAPRGEGGFGYDPLFYLPEQGRSAAELESGEKNRLSHRGRALAGLLDRLREPA